MTVKQYLAKVDKYESIDGLNNLIERAANDDEITHEEYCTVYEAAVNKLRRF
jgi:hypothetical protein